MDDLLGEVVGEDRLCLVLISVHGDQVEVLFGDFKGDELEDLAELGICDEATLLREDAEDVLKVQTLILCVDRDFPQNVLIVLHRVGRFLEIDLKLVIPRLLRDLLLRANEETYELIVVDSAVVA